MTKRRDGMSARVVPLTSSEAGDRRMGGTLAERVNAVTELTLAAWRQAGLAFPEYTRATTPIVISKLKDQK